MRTVAVTGAAGFIGHALAEELEAEGMKVVRVVRQLPNNVSKGDWQSGSGRRFFESCSKDFLVADLTDETIDWGEALQGVDCVFHCAAIADGRSVRDYGKVFDVNVGGALRVALGAHRAGVRRFIFLSSIKVWGEESFPGRAFSIQSETAPQTIYAKSKGQAEWELRKFFGDKKCELVIIRCPVVLGLKAGGNLSLLKRAISLGIPLPLASVKNRRSVIGIRSLVGFLIRCLDDPRCSGRILFVADVPSLSTVDLCRIIGSSIGVRVRLFHFPPAILLFFGALIGWRNGMRSLVGSLEASVESSFALLNHMPLSSSEDSVRELVLPPLERRSSG